MNCVPRIMVASVSSSSGKTTVTLAIMTALRMRGMSVGAFKCGPDYIDPLLHARAVDGEGYNLDLFFSDDLVVRGLLCEHSKGKDVCVIEGVMGYYDGLNNTEAASSYDIARVTSSPVVLVVSARGTALSIAAQVKGFLEFRPSSYIEGVIINHCSKRSYSSLKSCVEAETGVKVIGYMPKSDEFCIENRHLGLYTAGEISGFEEKLALLARQAEESIDLDELMAISHRAPEIEGGLPDVVAVTSHRPRIALARDDAFSFYYEDNLALLRRLGAEIVQFSPLKEEKLPYGTCGLYLGGGYPELYASRLSRNISMIEDVRTAIETGMPTLAECGGFMYLHEELEDDHEDVYPMVGAVKGRSFRSNSPLSRFGYVTLESLDDTMLCPRGEEILAHEFHYWDSTADRNACTARKADGRSWRCVVATNSLFAGFPHLYFYNNTAFASRFVKMAEEFGRCNETWTSRS